jgi:transposase
MFAHIERWRSSGLTQKEYCRKANIGEQVTEQLAMRPVQFYVKQYVYPKHLHRMTGKIYQTPAVDGTFARFNVDYLVAAHVVVQKLVDHLPLYRQAHLPKTGREPFRN